MSYYIIDVEQKSIAYTNKNTRKKAKFIWQKELFYQSSKKYSRIVCAQKTTR